MSVVGKRIDDTSTDPGQLGSTVFDVESAELVSTPRELGQRRPRSRLRVTLSRYALLLGSFAWAVLVGTSVSVQMVVSQRLNRHSDEPRFHALYVTTLSTLLGGIALLPVAARKPATAARWPSQKWLMLGGLCTLPAFVCIPAGKILGVQLVLLLQLMGMLSTALALDVRSDRLKLADKARLLGFGLVLSGVSFEGLQGASGGAFSGLSSQVMISAVFFTGVGFATQANCNGRLAQDVGGAVRATVISACVTVLGSIPIQIFLIFGAEVNPHLSLADWPLWIYAALQSVCYVGSLAVLPRSLGFTTTYLTLLMGKLVSSAIIDTQGLVAAPKPLTLLKCVSLAFVVAGATLFSGTASNSNASDAAEQVTDAE